MSKLFFQSTGESLTEEQRESLKKFESAKEKEMQEMLNQLNIKRDVSFMSAPFKPYEDRVLVFPDPVESKTSGGLYVPDEVIKKERPLKGTVVRVGPGKKEKGIYNQVPLKEGDRIAYGNYAGTEFEVNGIKYLIMRFSDIFGGIE